MTTSSKKLDARFQELRARGRKALVCYITAGAPSRDATVALMRALEEAGADVIEIGVPFSDPMADGPVIQASSQLALEQGTTLDDVLAMVHDAQVDIPVVLFSYLNPILAGGPDVLARAQAAGCDGVLVTDLPVGADAERERWFASHDLAFVRLVAPTTPVERMREIASKGSGFVYLISRLGVTGARADVPAELPETVARARAATPLPICVGFGVSTPEQARVVSQLADGVVVGTAIVKAANTSVESAAALVRAMRAEIDRSA